MSALPIKEIYVRYVEWVSRNPQTTSEIESAVKWVSYFLAGQVSNSNVISELVYSISNLIVLFNDNIIRRSQPLHNYGSAHKLKIWLTVLEYSEVFIEVSAHHVWGASGKWLIIALVQTFKCLARLTLLYRYNEHIVQSPSVAPLKRAEINNPTFQAPPEGFTLKSGRVIRTVDAAAPLMHRTWRPPEVSNCNQNGREDAVLTRTQILAEMLYITKPLVHLAALYNYGPKNWKPWLMALLMDLVSLQLLRSQASDGTLLSSRQRLELSRRQVSLLLYLLRSPFYETQTKDRLQRLLASASSTIPLVGIILRPLAEYIPHWQRTYFYMWSV